MRDRAIKIGNNNYEFENESFSNYRNWGHKTRLYLNRYLISENKCIYLNRTWESYQFQSCMKGAVYNLIEEEFENLILNYKTENNVKRLKSSVKEELRSEFENKNELFKVIRKL